MFPPFPSGKSPSQPEINTLKGPWVEPAFGSQAADSGGAGVELKLHRAYCSQLRR
jgi:hypothetical protein